MVLDIARTTTHY